MRKRLTVTQATIGYVNIMSHDERLHQTQLLLYWTETKRRMLDYINPEVLALLINTCSNPFAPNPKAFLSLFKISLLPSLSPHQRTLNINHNMLFGVYFLLLAGAGIGRYPLLCVARLHAHIVD